MPTGDLHSIQRSDSGESQDASGLQTLLTLVIGMGSEEPHPLRLSLSLKKEVLAVCRLSADSPIPAWASIRSGFTTISRTSDELSIVCPEKVVPSGIRKEGGWRIFKVDGPLDFALTGILASIAEPLAKARISIFAISTYDTDYVMVKNEKVDAASKVLRSVGHKMRID